jgi:hypothetical protein
MFVALAVTIHVIEPFYSARMWLRERRDNKNYGNENPPAQTHRRARVAD